MKIKMSEQEISFILKSYQEGKSSVEIAEKIKRNPKTVRKVIKNAGLPIRTKKEAAEASYKNGRTPPMSGKAHSERTKKKIGKSLHKNWTELSEENYKKRVDKARETWYNLDSSVREKILYNSRQALKLVSKQGSKLEQQLFDNLIKVGFSPVKHYRGFLHTKLEVDLYLPAQKTAIEIDGPSHFLPIYSEEGLEKTRDSDREKTLTLLGYGNVVIRFGFMREISKYEIGNLFDGLVDLVKQIDKKFPEEGKRYFEVFYE